MSGGTQNSHRPPRQHPHPLLHQISIWAGHAAEPSAAPRCDGSGGTFQTVARRQVRTVRKRRRERTAVVFQRAAQVGTYNNGKAAVVRRSAQVEIGTQYTLATLDEPSRCQVGPKILLDRPRQHPHPLLHQISIWAGHAAEPSAAPRCDGSGGTFQTVARRQVRTVRKRRRERTAVVFQRSAQVGTYTTERRRWFGGRRGWKSVRSTTLETLDEPSRCQVGPKILIDRPASTPIPSSIKFPFGLGRRPS